MLFKDTHLDIVIIHTGDNTHTHTDTSKSEKNTSTQSAACDFVCNWCKMLLKENSRTIYTKNNETKLK